MCGPRLYNSLPKYLGDIKTIWARLILELFPDEAKMPIYVSAVRRNSILEQLFHRMAQGIYKRLGLRLCRGAGLTAAKPLQVFLESACIYIPGSVSFEDALYRVFLNFENTPLSAFVCLRTQCSQFWKNPAFSICMFENTPLSAFCVIVRTPQFQHLCVWEHHNFRHLCFWEHAVIYLLSSN